MYWENIQGFFDFNNIYKDMAAKYDDAIFVEIGTWKGRSAVFMGEHIKDKNIKFYTVDVFEYHGEYDVFKTNESNSFYEDVLKNIEPVKECVNIIKQSSLDACDQFENESIDFLFLDGDHTYEVVKKELELWYPKVKIGGTIGGHDYSQPCGVKQAVDEFFSTQITREGSSWLKTK